MPKTRLLDHMRNVMRLKHMSLRTEAAYVSGVKRFILCHEKRHPHEMGADEIRALLTHLAVQSNVAASTQNGAFNALVFLYCRAETAVSGTRRDRASQTPATYPNRLYG
jgi:hypothetical protein